MPLLWNEYWFNKFSSVFYLLTSANKFDHCVGITSDSFLIMPHSIVWGYNSRPYSWCPIEINGFWWSVFSSCSSFVLNCFHLRETTPRNDCLFKFNVTNVNFFRRIWTTYLLFILTVRQKKILYECNMCLNTCANDVGMKKLVYGMSGLSK